MSEEPEQHATTPSRGAARPPMPDRAVTLLGEIKFTRKDVKAMNVLMCRRLIAALYQARAELNSVDVGAKRIRSSFPDFVPNQFVVIYGMKSLAVKSINEFLFGVRASRSREAADGSFEAEPIVYPFWRATHHGVPPEDRMAFGDFDFYIDLLGCVATKVGEEHTLKLKGVGAFWNLFGSSKSLSPLLIACTPV